MAKVDFKTEEGKKEAERIAHEIFYAFGNVQTEFSEYGLMTVTVDDVYVFKFATEESLLQTKLFWNLAKQVLK